MASNFVEVFFDEEVKAITDLVDKLLQFGPSHEEVARSTPSLRNVNLLLIRNSNEALAVKHLVKEGGWTGSVVMLLTKDSDDKDFESAVEVIQASGVAGYKVLLEVNYNAPTLSGPEENSPGGWSALNVLPKPDSEPQFHGAVSYPFVSAQSSAMVHQQHPLGPAAYDPVHGRRVRQKTQGPFRPGSSLDQFDQILVSLMQRVQAIEAAPVSSAVA